MQFKVPFSGNAYLDFDQNLIQTMFDYTKVITKEMNRLGDDTKTRAMKKSYPEQTTKNKRILNKVIKEDLRCAESFYTIADAWEKFGSALEEFKPHAKISK